MNREEFSNRLSLDVSRETWENLCLYVELLKKWQKKVNLVSPKTIGNLWERHMLDSAQLFKHISNADGSLVDLGSGAGFPALVLSIMGIKNIHLIESDRKKCSFLREVARKCGLSVNIVNDRIEDINIDNVSFVTARALSSLDNLLSYSHSFINDNTVCLFLKGQKAEEEVLEAKNNWVFSVELIPSIIEEKSCIVKTQNVSRETFIK